MTFASDQCHNTPPNRSGREILSDLSLFEIMKHVLCMKVSCKHVWKPVTAVVIIAGFCYCPRALFSLYDQKTCISAFERLSVCL